MGDYKHIINKLEQFIKKYYANGLLKGTILFFAIGLLYFLLTLFVEYVLWLSPTARTILFWCIVFVEIALFIRFILSPLLHLFKLRKGIDYKKASGLIGRHFPEVSDKLLNILQLSQSPKQSELLLASIEQKSRELSPVPFSSAISFKSNIKYLKYAAIPLAILLFSWVSGKIEWFSDSYERVVNYQTAYEPPAPFQFFVNNESLNAIEGKDYLLKVTTVGSLVPETVQIEYNNQTYFLQALGGGRFQYEFQVPKNTTEFVLTANEVRSRTYELEVMNTPNIVNFEMFLDYPVYTKKQDEVVKSSGSATVPEGTRVVWKAKTKATDRVTIYAIDTLDFVTKGKGAFEASRQLFSNFNYSLTTSNKNLEDYENLAYSIAVVKDAYPELNIKMKKDSLDDESLYFYGQISDDYGLSKLQLVYYPTDNEEKKTYIPIEIGKSNFSDFVSVFPNNQDIVEGKSYQLHFEVFDNDALHNFKRSKSTVFNYRKRTQKEQEQKQLQEQNKTINDISETFDKLKEQDKKLEEFSKTQKEKDQLNFNDKKRFEEFMKRQKQQEQLMKNFNKKLQDNLDEFQKDKEEKDQFKEDLKERLKENEEQLKKDEELLKELEEYKDKIDKEEFAQKLEELAKQNKNKQRSMKQLLELTKRFYVMKKAEKISNELDQLSKEQEALSQKEKENTSKAQDELNRKFEKIQKSIDELKQEDRRLQKPMDVQRDEFLEDEIKFDQNEAKEALEEQESNTEKQDSEESKAQQQKAKKKQKQAAKKMKKMSEMLAQMMSGGGGGGDQMGEDIEMLRQILENLLLYSFDQEDLMDTFESIDIDNNKYGKYIIEQSNLREHFEHIDDSLFALSMRQPKLSERVNSQITDVYFNIDKSLDLLAENRLYQGVAAQQYAITASNELASFLSDVLDNMEMSMNPSPGQGEGSMQLPDIIKSQEEIRKEAEEGAKKGEEGKEGEKSKDGQEGEKGEKGKEGESGKDGKKGQEGQGSESGQSGNEGNSKSSDGKGKNAKSGKSGNNGVEGQEAGKDSMENEGYGEGGEEEQNAQLFKIYQKQQQLRQALEDKLAKEGKLQSAGELIKQMEDIESDLLNYGFTNQTLQKMMDVQHQLLKLENATFLQGEDSKRQSETTTKEFDQMENSKLSNARKYFNTTEILNRQPLPLQNHVKKKIQEYFKRSND
ncbi:hypothetical protein J4050_00730 [Winogradskyella sp. DF17]|uniref:DUF4175 family protein n=1 Tax=Winogradskyella pelagia TaxID=2819984 RepID=A0ABS3SXM7_9FLAO|nr:DUF4175 family protein [Winogradskyella sp. DF17]MBO3115250.1 hypothetical protein [Winogradskyella sp. DF17]